MKTVFLGNPRSSIRASWRWRDEFIGRPEGDKGFNGTHRMMLSWHRADQGWVLTKVAWEKIGP